MAQRSERQRGFTLVELLVVIVILGVLSTIVAVNVLPAGDTARVRAAETQVQLLESAVRQYRLDLGTYPDEQAGLSALVEPPTGGNAARFRQGGYLDARDVPVDPWNNPYRYMQPGEGSAPFEIWSLGPDGREGTEDDIGSWQ